MLVCVFCLVVCCRTLSNQNVLYYIFGESFLCWMTEVLYDFWLCIISVLRTDVNNFLGDSTYLNKEGGESPTGMTHIKIIVLICQYLGIWCILQTIAVKLFGSRATCYSSFCTLHIHRSVPINHLLSCSSQTWVHILKYFVLISSILYRKLSVD
jgi:hypothetical protein